MQPICPRHGWDGYDVDGVVYCPACYREAADVAEQAIRPCDCPIEIVVRLPADLIRWWNGSTLEMRGDVS